MNIVGGASWAPLLELDDATWERDQRVNLKHHWLMGRAAAKQMIAAGRGGSIVVVASVSGMSGRRPRPYRPVQAGLLALVMTMADEWWRHGIRVNAVVPGAVRTPRIEAAWESGAIRRRPAADVVERMALPEDVAGAIAFLSSDLARRASPARRS